MGAASLGRDKLNVKYDVLNTMSNNYVGVIVLISFMCREGNLASTI